MWFTGQQYNNLFLPFEFGSLAERENNGRVGIKKAHPINSDELIIFCGEAF